MCSHPTSLWEVLIKLGLKEVSVNLIIIPNTRQGIVLTDKDDFDRDQSLKPQHSDMTWKRPWPFMKGLRRKLWNSLTEAVVPSFHDAITLTRYRRNEKVIIRWIFIGVLDGTKSTQARRISFTILFRGMYSSSQRSRELIVIYRCGFGADRFTHNIQGHWN